MEPESSLPCSQVPSIGPYTQPDESSPYRPILLKMHFKIILHLLLGQGRPRATEFYHHYVVCETIEEV
jgi:hypothetical protein